MSAADRRAARLWLLVLIVASALACWAGAAGMLDGEATAIPPLSLVAGIVGLVLLRPRTGEAPRQNRGASHPKG